MGSALGVAHLFEPVLCLFHLPFPSSCHVQAHWSGCTPQIAHVPLLTLRIVFTTWARDTGLLLERRATGDFRLSIPPSDLTARAP